MSPDGRWIAYMSDEGGDLQIHVASYPAFEHRRQISTAVGVQPQWSRDGRELFYLAVDGKLMTVPIKTDADGIVTGVPKQLFPTRVQVNPSEDQYAVVNGGERFIVMEPTRSVTPRIYVTLNWAAGLPK